MGTRPAEVVRDGASESPVRTGAVDAQLGDYFDRAEAQAAAISPEYIRLWRGLRASTAGGKRLRPALVLAAYRGFGGTDDAAAAARIGAAFELLHTALVIHDDVIDRDFRRRGVPNIAGVYRDSAQDQGLAAPAAEHRGQSAAIIAGDLALSGAFRLVAAAELPAPLRLRLLELLDEAVFASAGGELLDIEFPTMSPPPALRDVLQMSLLKTAVYSFELPLRAGALLAGAGEPAADLLGGVGRLMGTAYQLVDDLLGTFGDEQVTGKSAAGDLAEAKYTPLLAYASNCPEWPRIRALLAGAPGTREVALIRRLLESCGARAYVEDLAESYAARARDRLAAAGLPAGLRTDLVDLLEQAVRRSR
ncbi:polyprenyl synthetase family protein [Arthrobacter sp. I2-34]|uniref:Polyprenyl synthetase family protein n=1 Tax=Arthrobacter hankyongi TaxID=2904801 RepID=A0ABS9LDU1_9MICC|nr:polyprenyl synthetase family protein [Arthrobacter hankyongi]MCG2624857.1 polyprenyl synthetase family protein [Arthrobacter hankyongi]